jgi:acyl-CoA synthetase (AMP-forming)/AMP-acid ligase II
LNDHTDLGTATLCGLLNEQAARVPDHEALVFDDPLLGGETLRWTYSELQRQARRVARALLAVGQGNGARVGILMGNRPEAVASIFGAALAGSVAVPLSTFSSKPELSFYLDHADLSVLLLQSTIANHRLADDVAELCPSAAGTRAIDEPNLPSLRRVASLGPADDLSGLESWEAFLDGGEAVDDDFVDAISAQVEPSDLAVIIHSSGTTDRPKGVMHHHRAVTVQSRTQAELFGRDESTRVWCAMPLFWTAGLTAAMGGTLAAGATWVMQEAFEPGQALCLIERERVTEPHTFAHQARALADHPNWTTTDLSSCSRVFGKSVFTRHPSVEGDPAWNMPIGYGLSETASFFTALPHSAPREEFRGGHYGRLLPGNELRVLDRETGQALGPNQDGELTVRGPTLMVGYVGRTCDESFDADGFFRTGDVGRFDKDGYVYWTGRRTEMIKTSGANVSPAEIEVQLHAYEPIKLARVVGVPDERCDEVVVLCVELKDDASATEKDIKGFLRERLASYKVPRRVLFFGANELPLNPSGTKVRDDRLMALVQERMAR